MDVYKTPQFLQGVDDFELAEHVAEIEAKIQLCDTYFEVGKLFDGAYPYLKHRKGKFRLIGQVKSVANRTIQIFIFYRVFERADKEYLEFLRYKGQPRGTELVQQGFQEALVDEWAKSIKIKVKALKPLPPELRNWIEPLVELSVGRTRTEFHVHELDSWQTSVYENFIEADEGLRQLCELVVRVLDTDSLDVEIGKVCVAKPVASTSCTILWAKKSATEIALLYASVLPLTSDVIEQAQQTIGDTEYRARVKRAYFSIVAYSYELWRNIQKQEGGNIFLSEDEINSLTRMSGVDQGDSLPSVLSGRAGSGKSTMLAYVFAALLWKKAKHKLDGSPVYISYNAKLLANSRDLILLLLTANGDFGEQVENSSEDEKARLEQIKINADRYFFTFHDFLLSFIGDIERGKFTEAKRVDFSDFKRAYLGDRSLLKPFQNVGVRKTISAERAWFVIRQFIKGSLSNENYHGDEAIAELNANYHELSAKDQQGISFEVIDEVFKKVYETWYQPNIDDEQLWDDQDLVNAAHESSIDTQSSRRDFTAIVCDEAQDFTPREIRFIVRSSELLKYDLDKEKQLTLPYVLAGDSLQTLSPTGFRWSTVTSILYEEIFASSGVEVKTQTNQLSLNYRSARPVVDFCNFIQLTRKALFKTVEKEIQHQVAWDNSPRARPKYFQLNQNITTTELSDLVKNRILLIPCEESGEVDYINEDPILRNLFPNISETNLPPTVMSATAAKGLEYAHVFLYNFGAQFRNEGFEFDKSENNFAFEFFFNKLYVAASRAQNSLTIIEADDQSKLPGDTNFWQHFLSPIDEPDTRPHYLTQLVTKFPDFDGHVEFLETGHSGSWNDATARVSITEAEKFYSSGKENKDARLINRAASLFKQIGGEKNILKAMECDAYYLKFMEQNEAAGEAFENLGDLKTAWQIYLGSELWSHANNLRERLPDLENIEVALVRFMFEPRDNSEILSIFLAQLAKHFSGRERVVFSKPWLAAQNELTERLRLRLSSTRDSNELSEIIRCLEIIAQRDFVGLRSLLGEAHYITKNWSEALKAWHNTNLAEKEYEKHRALAKANNRGFPEGLRELSSANFKREVVEVWREHGSPKDKPWLAEVIPAMQSLKDFNELLSLCLTEHRVKDALVAYRGLSENNPESAQEFILDIVTECSKNFEYFGDLKKLFDDATNRGQFNIKELCEIVMINAVKVWNDPQHYGFDQKQMQMHQQNLLKVGFGDGQREAFLHVVRLYQPSKEEKQLDPRWWGLCFELSADWQSAATHYLQYAEAKDKPQIMEISRFGYIRSQFRLIKHYEENGKQSSVLAAQKEFRSKINIWKFSEDDRRAALQPKKLGSNIEFYIEPTNAGDFTEDGGFGPFSWKTSDKVVRLAFDETDIALSWRIEQTTDKIVSNTGRLSKEADGCYRFDAGLWHIEVRFSQQETKLSIKKASENNLEVKVLKFKVSK